MARLPITIYRHSFLATVVSLIGSVLMLSGLYLLFVQALAGVACILIGIVYSFIASAISKRKQFRLWIKSLKQQGIIALLPTSRELCLQVYQANPQKRTINFIAKYNPAVAQELTIWVKQTRQKSK